MPHQRYVADVALEIDEETGLLAYRTVIVVGPRQVMGKTELMLPVMVHRAVGFGAAEGPQEIRYAAQDGIEARRKWLDVHVPRLEASPYRRQFHDRRRTSAEAIQWRNGSVHSPIAGGTRKSGTSDSLDLAVIDEAWVHDDTRIEQGLRPTMLTRVQPQIWIASMVPGPSRAKTTKSSFLRAKMDQGRKLAEAGVRRGTAYFEYSAPPRTDGRKTDPGDEATWLSCMPALCPAGPPCRCDPAGHWRHTVFVPAVREDYESMSLLDFTAEYLSWWPDETATGWRVITEAEWEAVKRPQARMRPPIALCAWVTPDRSWAAIAAAGYRDGGRLVEITGGRKGRDMDYRQGTGWVLPRLRQLQEKHQPIAIVTNDRSLADQAADPGSGLQLHRMQAGDEASAAGMLLDGLAGKAEEGRDVRHLGQHVLTVAMAAVAKRSQGQWWVWDRAEDDTDIAPVPTVSGALWALMTPRVHIDQPAPAGRPRVRWL